MITSKNAPIILQLDRKDKDDPLISLLYSTDLFGDLLQQDS
jgi:hypothetical protein